MAGKARGAAIGIDLGTTYSCVGYWKNDRIEIIANDQGNRTTPSYVAFTQNDRLIGDAAHNQVAFNPINTIFDAKRLIGRKFYDDTVQSDMKLWPFKVVCGTNDRPMFCVAYKGENKQFTAEEISSMVITRMKQIAETFVGSEVNDAVITVPAYFDQTQRQATIDAGTIAGMNVLKIIDEPTAAAIAYGLDSSNRFTGKRNVLIFDLGGGTFDVSILAIQPGNIEVKSIAGDTHLGGADFDSRLVNHFIKDFKRKHDKDITDNPKAVRRLRTACEKGKRLLTFATETRIDIDALFQGIDFSAVLSRSKFEELNMDLFEKCIETVRKCLMDVGMNKNDIDDIVLVGGSTRILKLQQMMRNLFDSKELCSTINPDEAVAYGAAVQAAMLSNESNVKVPNIVLVEVTPLSLGVQVEGEIMSVVIPKHTITPVSRVHRFSTSGDNQTAVEFKVFEGERARTTDNKLLGLFTLTDIQLAPRGVPEFDVWFNLEATGILNVFARDRETGAQNSITIESGRLAGEEIERMIEEANKFKADDERIKEKSAARSAFEIYAREMRDDIRVKYRLSGDEKKEAEDAVEKAFEWLDSRLDLAEVSEYEEKKKELMMRLKN